MLHLMIILLLTWLGIGCWIVCFWWMRRISTRQDAMLRELQEMAARIEKISRTGHDLIKEVHPQVGEIKEQVESMAEVVSSDESTKER